MANKPTAAANRKDATDPASAGRIKQIRMVAGIIRKSNPRALPLVALAGLGVIAVFVIVGLLTGLAALLIPLGVAAGLMVAMIIFGRYAQSAQYKAVEGQPGAAAAIMQGMRGGWTVTPRADFYYQAKSFARIFNAINDKLDSYTNTNVSLIFANAKDGWRVQAYVKNLTKETVVTDHYQTDDTSGLFTNIFLTEPRTYGVAVTKEF